MTPTGSQLYILCVCTYGHRPQPFPFLRSQGDASSSPLSSLLPCFVPCIEQAFFRAHLVPGAGLGFRCDGKNCETCSLPTWIVSRLGRWSLYLRRNGTKNGRVHVRMRSAKNKTHSLSSWLQAKPELSGADSSEGSQALKVSV